jgi:hypothetical protein
MLGCWGRTRPRALLICCSFSCGMGCREWRDDHGVLPLIPAFSRGGEKEDGRSGFELCSDRRTACVVQLARFTMPCETSAFSHPLPRWWERVGVRGNRATHLDGSLVRCLGRTGNRAEREDARLLGQNARVRSAGPKRLLLGRSPYYGSEAASLHGLWRRRSTSAFSHPLPRWWERVGVRGATGQRT